MSGRKKWAASWHLPYAKQQSNTNCLSFSHACARTRAHTHPCVGNHLYVLNYNLRSWLWPRTPFFCSYDDHGTSRWDQQSIFPATCLQQDIHHFTYESIKAELSAGCWRAVWWGRPTVGKDVAGMWWQVLHTGEYMSTHTSLSHTHSQTLKIRQQVYPLLAA